MADQSAFDEPHEAVMELVLSSDDEFTDADVRSPRPSREDRRLRRHELAARFLPGVDAGALFALGVGLVSLTSASMIEILAQNSEISDSYTHPNADLNDDPLAGLRHLSHLRFLGQGGFAVASIVIAFAVLSRWRPDRHARWSRPIAQAALLLGLLGLTIAVLGYFDVIGGLPDPKYNPVHIGALQG